MIKCSVTFWDIISGIMIVPNVAIIVYNITKLEQISNRSLLLIFYSKITFS